MRSRDNASGCLLQGMASWLGDSALTDQCTTGASDQVMGTAVDVLHWVQNSAEAEFTLNCFKHQQAAVKDHLECPGVEAGKSEGHES